MLQAERIALELLEEDLQVQEILDSRYERQDLENLVRNQKHLSKAEQQKLATSDMTTFILPSGLYKYRRLPMGLSVSPDIFQGHMQRLFADMENAKIYIDDLLIYTKGSFDDHLRAVDEALRRLQSKNMSVNAEKTFWAVKEVDYLGFRLTQQGVMPQPKKVAAIQGMRVPRNKKQMRSFIGLVNFYRYMWRRRSHLLAPLAELAGKKTKYEWTTKHQEAFDAIEAAVSKDVLLSFPDYALPFDLYTDASDYQMGAVLMQGTKTLAFWSRKLKPEQKNYGVGEKEMLSVVEALKEFRTMILGYSIHIYTDHKNWTHDKIYRNARVLRWQMEIEDFGPTFHYIKGEKNSVADALSRLPIDPVSEDEGFNLIQECFDLSPFWRDFQQPITLKEIGEKQKKDPHIQQLQEQAPDALGQLFEDIGKKTGPDSVLTIRDSDNQARIIVPEVLRKRLTRWYHETLLHPGINRMYNTLHQHYTWPRMKQDIENWLQGCDACQRAKRGGRGYGHIPLKDVETAPWKDVAVDLAGPWTTTIDEQKVDFHTFTIIDVFTGWVEIIPIRTKSSQSIADLFQREWIHRYPRPSRCIFDLGGEFDSKAFHAVLTRWFIKPEPITVKNPRANAIVERMHKVLGDMIRIQLTSKHKHDEPISDLTSAAAYAIRATVHGTTKHTPSQLVYAKDMILRTKIEANVEHIRTLRENAIYKNNQRENKRRIKYDYQEGDRVLVLSGGLDPKLKLHQGPYRVLSYDKASGTTELC
jgi:transposase InsO family protein